MAMIQKVGFGGTVQEVAPYKRAAHVTHVPRGASYAIAQQTGTIGAALAANSSVFGMRLDPAAGGAYKLYVERIRLEFTTIVAFTTPITAARRLGIYRGAGGAPSGGTGPLEVVKKDTADGNSEVRSAQGGAAHIATTGALTMTGVTFEADPFRLMTLVHVGAAGAFREVVWEFNSTDSGGPLVLNQGEVLAIRNPAAMDAAGTWQLGVNVDWIEGNGI